MKNCWSWLGYLLPACCQLCGDRTANSDSLCKGCSCDLPAMPSIVCPCCAVPLSAAGLCGQCIQNPPAFTRTTAALPYEHLTEQLIHRFKFGADHVAGHTLATLLAIRAKDADTPQTLVPVPISRQRLQARGFNQSWELARYIGKVLHVPVNFTGVRRISDHVPQSTLQHRNARKRNVHNVFHVEPTAGVVQLENKHVTIIDDVMTSGATANSLAQTLLLAGAKRVDVWVVSRAGLRQNSR